MLHESTGKFSLSGCQTLKSGICSDFSKCPYTCNNVNLGDVTGDMECGEIIYQIDSTSGESMGVDGHFFALAQKWQAMPQN